MLKNEKAMGDVRWLVAVMLVAATFTGCGPKEEPEPVTPVPAPEPVVEEAQVPAGVTPVTLEVLQLMPESTTVAIAFPPLSGLHEKAVTLAKRLAPADVDVDAIASEAVAETAAAWDVPEATTFEELLAAKGIDPNAPGAVFIDASASEEAVADLGRLLGGMAAMSRASMPTLVPGSPGIDLGEEPGSGEGTDAAAGQGPESGAEEEPVADQVVDAPVEGPPKMLGLDRAELEARRDALIAQYVEILRNVSIACVVPCADPAAVRDLAVAALGEKAGLGDLQPEQVVEGNIAVTHYAGEIPFCYFETGDRLIVGNSLDLVRDVAARLASPAPVRYGTEECPASETDEIVELVRMDVLMPLMKDFADGMADADPVLAMLSQMQANAWADAAELYTDPDPLVVTLAWTDERIEILSRLDTAKHTKVLEKSGMATPLEQAVALPESTSALFALRLTPEAKEQFVQSWQGTMPPELQDDPAMGQRLQMIQMVTGMVRDEITIAVHGQEDGLPQAMVMIGLEEPETAKGFLQAMLGLSMEPTEIYKGVDIMSAEDLPLPEEKAVYYAFTQEMLMITNDLAGMKSALDLLQEGAISGLFESLDPPWDPTLPRYSAILVRDTLLSEVIGPLVAAGSGGIPEQDDLLTRVADVIRDLRLSSEVDENWLQSRMSVYFD